MITKYLVKRQDDNGDICLVATFRTDYEALAALEHYNKMGHTCLYYMEESNDEE